MEDVTEPIITILTPHNKKNIPCSIKGCDSLARGGKGWCSSHYMRWTRYGNPMIKKRQAYENHGLRKLVEYEIWAKAKQRCLNRNSTRYKYYGGRGIKICSSWINSFSQFYKDMGARPPGRMTLERINNDGDYEPSNCRWATYTEQNRNKRKKGQA